MTSSAVDAHKRILIIDDNPAIHEDFRKILLGGQREDPAMAELLLAVLGTSEKRSAQESFELDSAFQGREGLAKVSEALAQGRPYALAFVDVRMPPGWDGVETITHLWAQDTSLQVVLCTAYSDFSWQEIVERLGDSDRFVILKKPFDNIEVLQLAHAMTRKWVLTRQVEAKVDDLDRRVRERTAELEAVNARLTAEILERARTQTALRISEERLASAFDACPMPTAILRVVGQRVFQANPAFLAATGRATGELVGRSLWEVGIEVPQSVRDTVAGRLFEGQSLRRQACEFRTPGGAPRQGLLWLEPFTLGAGPHLLAVLEDVTAQNALESELRQSQKMEAVGHLAAGVAHDFNNLLTIIQCHVSMQLKDPRLEAGVAEAFDGVQQAAERAGELTRQLLAFGRRQLMEKNSLSLNSVVANLAPMLERLIPESIRVHFSNASQEPLIHGDRGNIEQVLLNFVVNARDAMPRGGDLFISTALEEISPEHLERVPEARVGCFACLQVRDTGTGIDSRTLGRIFEPFFTTKDVGKGSGMGLATVHGIVKQHDGWVEVASALGSGTSFRVFLPLIETPVPAPELLAPPSTDSVHGRTVLLAEDDRGVRLLVGRVLRDAGMIVLDACDGGAAFALWQEHRERIDLLLTDMVMPGNMSGAELAERILAEHPGLPVIYSSGYSVELFSDTFHLRKDVNYLPKPYLASQLKAIVAGALAATPAQAPALPVAAALKQEG